ncbi:MAG: ATP-dependent 6-phosphofructokinase [Clostridiales bacterium]|jgi:6-phosphofructokinase 1|nr:ATP-dependent 6-phosphofructokinase [Clostridiales bacterium]
MAKTKIAVLTGGGDAPGLNAVIYALTRSCKRNMDCELIGYKFGYRGLYHNDFMPLTMESTTGILHKGGTILYSSNKDNLFNYALEENGQIVKKDVSDIAVENMKKEGVDVLVVLGGDGTLTSARDFARKGVNVVGIPKTIDNDLVCTEQTFGFDSAVNIVAENLGRLHTTTESHHRVMVVEVMGRSAGWLALQSGIAGSADVILIPEIPYSLDKVVEKIYERDARGKYFTIIVVTEGAIEKGGAAVVGKMVADSPDPVRFGGIAAKIAMDLEKLVVHEIRSCALGHIQRGGDTSAFDRVLSVRYGVAAADLIRAKKFGNMVCFREGRMDYVSLEDVISGVCAGKSKNVDPHGELVRVAKDLGITFGD